MLFLILLGDLRHINKLRHGPLDCVLHDKNLFLKEADAIALFLTPTLGMHPDKRAKASDLVHHNWLDGVLVQGETDVTGPVEQDETRGRRRAVICLLEGTCHLTQGHFGPE